MRGFRSLLAMCLRVEQTIIHLYLLSPVSDVAVDTPELISDWARMVALPSPFRLLTLMDLVSWLHGSHQTPIMKSRQGLGTGERLIPAKGLPFYIGSELLPSLTPCFTSHWPGFELELTPKALSWQKGMGLPYPIAHPWDEEQIQPSLNGGPFCTLKSGVCLQKIREGDSWVSN